VKPSLLIVDDDPGILTALRERFTARGYEVSTATDGDKALAAAHERPDVVLLDLQLPKRDGLEVLTALRQRDDGLTIVMITAHGTVTKAVAAMKAGAYDFVEKPFDSDQLEKTVARAAERARLLRRDRARAETSPATTVIGDSAAMQKLLATATKAAASDATILVTGESGTGKEVLAQQIHRWSSRVDEALIAVNCAALAESLLESELFGHERGAFTGADRKQPGRIELAHRGTLFLDEIGEVTPAFQAKLLRVLQERTFERVGGRETVQVDVRIVAATNRDLQAAVGEGRFREDLFYRLNVIALHMPPLRDRREDIIPLARHFATEFGARSGREFTFDAAFETRIRGYAWPGNVRELRNVIERATVMADSETIGIDDLPPEVLTTAALPAEGYHAKVEACRRQLLQEALAQTDGNRTRAAELLGLQRTYLARLLRQYGIGNEHG